jgi:hypothetical protein
VYQFRPNVSVPVWNHCRHNYPARRRFVFIGDVIFSAARCSRRFAPQRRLWLALAARCSSPRDDPRSQRGSFCHPLGIRTPRPHHNIRIAAVKLAFLRRKRTRNDRGILRRHGLHIRLRRFRIPRRVVHTFWRVGRGLRFGRARTWRHPSVCRVRSGLRRNAAKYSEAIGRGAARSQRNHHARRDRPLFAAVIFFAWLRRFLRVRNQSFRCVRFFLLRFHRKKLF